MTQTRINRRWLFKIGVFALVLAGLGVWGLVDALIVYPNRGFAYAEWAELNYLRASQEAGQLLQASVDDPRQRLQELRERRSGLEQDLAATRSSGGLAAARVERQLALLEWLTALSRVGALPAGPGDPDGVTAFDDPRQRLNELEADWRGRAQPKPLSAYDIPLQWVIVVVGFGGAIWVLGLMISVVRRTYRYDPRSRTLTLPDGRSFSASDIREVDKRKWDKFFVTIRLEGGDEVRLDLLRYTPLEEWVLEMEKASPVAPAEERSEGAGAPAGEAPAGAAESPDAPDAPGEGGADVR